MNYKDFIFSSVMERDVDFAIINSFVTNEKVRQLFFDKIQRSGNVLKAFQSYTDKEEKGGEGESDIIFVCEDEQGSYAIFIEDKINADQQPRQRERYNERGTIFITQNQYAAYYVFLCAPQEYLNSDKAKKYKPNVVSHEEIENILDGDDMHKAIFKCSIEKKVNNYNPIRDDMISDFWNELANNYVAIHYPDLDMCYNKKDKPSKSFWPEFRTGLDGLKIIWKSDRDYIDLEISRKSELLKDPSFCFQLGKLLSKDVVFVNDKTLKSVSVRYNFSSKYHVAFDKSFKEQEANIKFALDIVQMFSSFCNDIRIEKYVINK